MSAGHTLADQRKATQNLLAVCFAPLMLLAVLLVGVTQCRGAGLGLLADTEEC